MARLPGVPRPDRVVAHVDVDCFYAACERLREPSLEGKPVVVGMGYEPGETHGAVATASYEARRHGVESAMAISEALQLLPRHADADDDSAARGFYRSVDVPFYESVAAEVDRVLETATETVRKVSIDESYLDVGDLTFEEAAAFGRELKADVRREAGVVASVGIAPDMTTAKLASDAEKPDGLVVVEPDDVAAFLAPIDVAELHGVGPVTARELREMGLQTAGDVAATEETMLVDALGERGRDLYAQARGIDDREVEPRGRPKSLSRESTFVEPTADTDDKHARVRELAADVTERAAAEGALYRTIGLKVVRPPFEVNTRERSLSGPVCDPDLVETVVVDLLAEFADDRVRKLGVVVSKLSFDDREQTSLDAWETADDSAVSEAGEPSNRHRPSGGQTDLSEFD